MTTSTHGEPPHGGLSDDELRAGWRTAETAYENLGRVLRLSPLPEFWDDPECCDKQSLQVVEPGIIRWENVDDFDVDERTMHAYTRGYDAYSETGLLEYLECMACHKVWACPDTIDWD